MWQSSEQQARRALAYAAAALFCGLFAWIYEHFSHDVWSYPMVFAFAYPLAGGLMPVLAMKGPARPAVACLWRAGLAALTVGSLFRGALEIFGTGHPLTAVYVLLGVGLCAAAAAVQLWPGKRSISV